MCILCMHMLYPEIFLIYCLPLVNRESADTAVTISKPLCNSSVKVEERNPEVQCTGDSLVFERNEKLVRRQYKCVRL